MQYGAGRGDKTIIKCARSRACRFDRRVELEGLSRPVVLGATIRPIYPQVNRNIISLSLSLQPPPPPPPLPSPVRLPVHTMSHPPAAPVLTRPRRIDLSRAIALRPPDIARAAGVDHGVARRAAGPGRPRRPAGARAPRRPAAKRARRAPSVGCMHSLV